MRRQNPYPFPVTNGTTKDPNQPPFMGDNGNFWSAGGETVLPWHPRLLPQGFLTGVAGGDRVAEDPIDERMGHQEYPAMEGLLIPEELQAYLQFLQAQKVKAEMERGFLGRASRGET